MSFSYDIISDENLQVFLTEKLPHLSERVEFKNKIAEKLKNVLPENQFNNFCACGDYIAVNEKMEVVQGNFCKNRLCPVCNRKYAAQKWHKIKIISEQITNVFSPIYALLTLTVKNVPAEKLSEEITHLMKSIDRMHKTSLWKEKVLGFFRSLEITYNSESKTYHPHYHYIICLPTNYEKEMTSTYEWRKLWERSARLEYNSQIDLQLISTEEQLSGGIAEVAKYAVKISSVVENGEDALKPLQQAIRGRRLISFGGIIKEIAKEYDKKNKKSAQELDKIPVASFIYQDGQYKRFY